MREVVSFNSINLEVVEKACNTGIAVIPAFAGMTNKTMSHLRIACPCQPPSDRFHEPNGE